MPNCPGEMGGSPMIEARRWKLAQRRLDVMRAAGRGIGAVPDDFAAFIPAAAIPKYTPGLIAPDAAALIIWARDPSGSICGAQRIFVSDDGKKTPVETDDGMAAKFTTGRGGGALIALPQLVEDVTGGAVVAVEGPEGCAAVWQSSGAETWAVFGVSGWAGLVDLLPRDRRVILCPDADAIGSQAWVAFRSALSAMVEAGIDCHVAETPAIYGPKSDLLDAMERDGPGAVVGALQAARAAGASSFPLSRPNDDRDVIGAEMRDFIREWIFSNQGDDAPRNALVRGSQGLGKSTAARAALVDMVEGVALAAYPTKEKSSEEYTAYCSEKRPYSPRPVLYRSRATERLDGSGGPMCIRCEEAEEMIRNALEPALLCEGCPFALGCGDGVLAQALGELPCGAQAEGEGGAAGFDGGLAPCVAGGGPCIGHDGGEVETGFGGVEGGGCHGGGSEWVALFVLLWNIFSH